MESLRISSMGESVPIGDIANRVADPNWIDPSRTVRGTGDANLDKDAFFKMMLAQLENQNPLNPLESHEMAAQLAQFTSLEQLTHMNESLTEIKNAQKPNDSFQALNFLGHYAHADSSRFVRNVGDMSQTLHFNLGRDAEKVRVNILDSQGRSVRELVLTNMQKGSQAVEWNGLTNEGRVASEGQYRMQVEAVGSNGVSVAASTGFSGKVTGVSFHASGPVLTINGQNVRLSDINRLTGEPQDNLIKTKTEDNIL